MQKQCEVCGATMSARAGEKPYRLRRRRCCGRSCAAKLQRKDDPRLSDGYRYRTVKIAGRNRLAHRVVMERMLGGPIPAGAIVHHKNGNKLDNRPENLELLTAAEHSQHHNQKHAVTKRCVICSAEFTPHPTKRARQQSCGAACKRALLRLRAEERRRRSEAA